MKKNNVLKVLLLTGWVLGCTHLLAFGKTPARQWYQLTVYHFKNATQEKQLDDYLQQAWLPALHATGIAKVGVFKVIGNDTAADKRLYVLLPVASVPALLQLQQTVTAGKTYQAAAQAYTDAPYNAPAYERMESILLQAFPMAPVLQVPQLTGKAAEHVYELRSYESPSEKLHANKGNAGGVVQQPFEKGSVCGVQAHGDFRNWVSERRAAHAALRRSKVKAAS